MTENPYSTIATRTPSAIFLEGALAALPVSEMTSSYRVQGGSAVTASAAASASINLTAADLSQAAAAASSQALAEASGSTVTALAQVIIAIGVIPVQVIIVAVVLGIHRLMHRKSPRSPQTCFDSATPAEDSLPYLQPKAELEDEQTRRNELHGEHLVYELDGEDEILEISDETDFLVLPLQGRQGVHEMPEPHDLSWKMPLQGREEVMGDECAQELECPMQRTGTSIETAGVQELESSVRARNECLRSKPAQGVESSVQEKEESIKVEKTKNLTAAIHDAVPDSTHYSLTRSHFMLRQQQIMEIDDLKAADQHGGIDE